MTRRAAFTEADLRRALRVARAEGAPWIEVRGIRIPTGGDPMQSAAGDEERVNTCDAAFGVPGGSPTLRSE